MNLKILLPSRIFAETSAVARINVQTLTGSFGLLPHRLDCVVALTPGILTWQGETGGERFAAIDDGVLVKAGPEVFVSVRRAYSGSDLAQLHQTVLQQLLVQDDKAQAMRAVMSRLESGFLHRFAAMQHG
jgi:F-type H+-transporting ATPase subunit epsilon